MVGQVLYVGPTRRAAGGETPPGLDMFMEYRIFVYRSHAPLECSVHMPKERQYVSGDVQYRLNDVPDLLNLGSWRKSLCGVKEVNAGKPRLFGEKYKGHGWFSLVAPRCFDARVQTLSSIMSPRI
jgi:hypothetical protein